MCSSGLRGTAENPATLAANQKRRLIVATERDARDSNVLVGADLCTQATWQALRQQHEPTLPPSR